jgi:hypothetical protein
MMQLFQTSKLMTIILQWQKQQQIRMSLKKQIGEMNNHWIIFLGKIKTSALAYSLRCQTQQNITI